VSDNRDKFLDTPTWDRRWRRGVGEFTYRLWSTDEVTAFRPRPVWEVRVYQRPTSEYGGPGTRLYPWESIRFYRSPDKAKATRKAEAYIRKELSIKRRVEQRSSRRLAYKMGRTSVVEEGPVVR